MILSTRIGTKSIKYTLSTFEEFYDRFVWLTQNVESIDLNAIKSCNFNSDIVKNRFKKFWGENKDKKVSVRQIKYGCNSKICNIVSKEFYIDRGWTEEEAIKKISEIQKSDSRKSAEKMTDDRLTTQIGYWLKHGYSEEEAKKKLSERQLTFTLEKCIEKYGEEEEGKKKWKERQDKWQKTLNERHPIEEQIEWKRKGMLANYCASREATELFLPFYNTYKDTYKCFLKTDGSQELYLKDNETGVYFLYDFSIEELKIIFEYNGIHVHPNPNWDKERWNSWRHCFNQKTADEVYNKYKIKIRLAEQNGYKLVQLWSSSTRDENESIIKNEISAKVQSLQQ